MYTFMSSKNKETYYKYAKTFFYLAFIQISYTDNHGRSMMKLKFHHQHDKTMKSGFC